MLHKSNLVSSPKFGPNWGYTNVMWATITEIHFCGLGFLGIMSKAARCHDRGSGFQFLDFSVITPWVFGLFIMSCSMKYQTPSFCLLEKKSFFVYILFVSFAFILTLPLWLIRHQPIGPLYILSAF